MNNRPRVLVFASGSKDGGGSGFAKLVEASRLRKGLEADIIGVVSNHEAGGVNEWAKILRIPFYSFKKPYDANGYQRLAMETGADFFALSGWLKLVEGLNFTTRFNPRTVFNIHPGPLPAFGGAGMYGHHVHEAVVEAYNRGEITHSAVTMHFVDEVYDRGPVFFRYHVAIRPGDTAETLGRRVNAAEHAHQWRITNLVVNGFIKWDGVNKESLTLPPGYEIDQYEE